MTQVPEEGKFNIQYEERAASTLRRFGMKKIQSAIEDGTGKRVPSRTGDEESEGVKMSDVWSLSILAPSSKERLGYPTQKPLTLLERIVRVYWFRWKRNLAGSK
jgi:site-specific DNA-methyltransferase (adenine-specific)